MILSKLFLKLETAYFLYKFVGKRCEKNTLKCILLGIKMYSIGN